MKDPASDRGRPSAESPERDDPFRRAFEGAPLAMALLDQRQRFAAANRRFRDVVGYSADELSELTLADVADPEGADRVLGVGALNDRAGLPPEPVRTHLVQKSGAALACLLVASRVHEGSDEATQLVVTGIGQRDEAPEGADGPVVELVHRMRALEASKRELEALNAAVSHDLKGSLLTIVQFSQRLTEDAATRLSEDDLQSLGRIRAAGMRAKRTIDDLRALFDASHREIFPERVDLSQLARQVVAELQELSPGRRVAFDARPGIEARGDPTLLRLLLQNLLGNAWKYTAKRDGARIEFQAEPGPIRSVFYVRDNGIGFDNRDRDRIFQAFERLHDDSDFDGSGLGLATALRIVRRHGGDMWAEGVPGSGATVWFTLYESAPARFGQ